LATLQEQNIARTIYDLVAGLFTTMI